MNTNPSSPPQFTALAERCEQAAGPDRELDKATFQALPFGVGGSLPGIPMFTASLDAAITLVPEGLNLSAILHEVAVELFRRFRIDEPAKRAAFPRLLCAAALRAKDQS